MISADDFAFTDQSVHAWRVNLDASHCYRDDLISILDDGELQRLKRFLNDEVRHRYIVCRGLLRLFLSAYVGISPREIEFALGSHGKPRLAGTQNDDGLVFNLSHSGAQALFAFGRDTRLGVDVEIWRRIVNLEGIVERCFANEEKQYWYQLAQEQREAAFFAFWTRKESFVKAVGKGISLGLDQCIISLGSEPSFSAIPKGCGKVSDWSLSDISTGHGVSAALSVNLPSCRIIERETSVKLLLNRHQ